MSDLVNNNSSGLWGAYDVDKTTNQTDSYVNIPKRVPNPTLDKDAFLKLLLTQMQMQDPLSPMDNKDMLVQMTQLTNTEQMQNVSKSFEQQQTYSLVGKTVYANYYNEESKAYEDIEGTVDFVRVKGSTSFLVVQGKEVPLSKVQYVYGDGLAQNVNNLNSNSVTTQAMALISRVVQAVVINKDGAPEKFVEGRVDFVKFDNKGKPVIVVGKDEFYPNAVTSVSDDKRIVGRSIAFEDVNSEGGTTTTNGKISDVNIRDGKAYLVIDGKETYVKNVPLVSDALSYVNQSVDYDGQSGNVKRVIIRGGKPYLDVGDFKQEVDFAKFKGIDL